MSSTNNSIIKIIKLVDYSYLNNYILLNIIDEETNSKKNVYNDWKIFSNHNYDEKINIFYFLKLIKHQNDFSYEKLLLIIHIYIKICQKYAHLIDNYTYLFATVYISINNLMFIESIEYFYLAEILKINHDIAKKMIVLVDNFIDTEKIYFSTLEKQKILNKIK